MVVLKHSWYVSMLLKAKYGSAKMESGVTIMEKVILLWDYFQAQPLYNDKRFSYLPVHMGSSDSGTSTTVWNFGQKPFKFAPPEGFQPINAANIRPEVVISRPDQYVGVVTYTGAGATAQGHLEV